MVIAGSRVRSEWMYGWEVSDVHFEASFIRNAVIEYARIARTGFIRFMRMLDEFIPIRIE